MERSGASRESIFRGTGRKASGRKPSMTFGLLIGTGKFSTQPVRSRDREAVIWIDQFRTIDREFQEIHRGRADEAGDKSVGGLVVNLKRRSGLLNETVFHHDDGVAHGHRFGLVVRDIDRRHTDFLVHLGQEASRFDTQLGVKVRQRLVHEKDTGAPHKRASKRDALPLSARKGLRQPVKQRVDSQPIGDAANLRVDFASSPGV